MVVSEVLLQHPCQMLPVENDEVPQALLAKGANEALHVPIALGPVFRDLDRPNPTVGCLAFEGLPIQRITVPDQAPRALLEGRGFHDLAGYADVGGLVGDAEVDDAASGMSEDHEHVQCPEADGRHAEPAACLDMPTLSSQEGDPARRGRVRRAFHGFSVAMRRSSITQKRRS
jgi:hypothetical protein